MSESRTDVASLAEMVRRVAEEQDPSVSKSAQRWRWPRLRRLAGISAQMLVACGLIMATSPAKQLRHWAVIPAGLAAVLIVGLAVGWLIGQRDEMTAGSATGSTSNTGAKAETGLQITIITLLAGVVVARLADDQAGAAWGQLIPILYVAAAAGIWLLNRIAWRLPPAILNGLVAVLVVLYQLLWRAKPGVVSKTLGSSAAVVIAASPVVIVIGAASVSGQSMKATIGALQVSAGAPAVGGGPSTVSYASIPIPKQPEIGTWVRPNTASWKLTNVVRYNFYIQPSAWEAWHLRAEAYCGKLVCAYEADDGEYPVTMAFQNDGWWWGRSSVVFACSTITKPGKLTLLTADGYRGYRDISFKPPSPRTPRETTIFEQESGTVTPEGKKHHCVKKSSVSFTARVYRYG